MERYVTSGIRRGGFLPSPLMPLLGDASVYKERFVSLVEIFQDATRISSFFRQSELRFLNGLTAKLNL